MKQKIFYIIAATGFVIAALIDGLIGWIRGRH
jgi:hypothetical protein